MHDGIVGLDGSADNIIAILEVDNDDFGCGIIINLLANANISIGFESLQQLVNKLAIQRRRRTALLHTHELKVMELLCTLVSIGRRRDAW